MPISNKKKRTAIYSVIIILVLIFGIIFPLYHLYDPLFNDNPAVTVNDGYYNVTYAKDFKNISGDYFPFSTNVSKATITDTDHPDSILDLSLSNGNIFYTPYSASPANALNIIYNLVIYGHFTDDLHPSSLAVSFGAVGQNQSTVILTTLAPPLSTAVPEAENVSVDTLGNLILAGAGSVSVTAGLLNESSSVPFYNFYVSVMMQVFVKWLTGSSHVFDLTAQVNGLSRGVTSTLSLAVVEL